VRTWISFRTGIRGIRVGVALPNPAARVYPVVRDRRAPRAMIEIVRSGAAALRR
jgi:hypothetical protein